MRRALSIICLFYTVQACSPSLQTVGDPSAGYTEDLSSYRPAYETTGLEDTSQIDTTNLTMLTDIEPLHDITDTLNAVLDSISVLSQQVKYVDGYTVQVYSGSNREAANIARGKAYTLEPYIKPNLFYDSPNFKVHVGQFYSSLEANETYAQMKQDFPNAILVLRKFKIKRN